MLSLQTYIERHKLKHTSINYIYSNTVYKGLEYKISVSCPRHGEFTFTAINYAGCPKCKSKFENDEKTIKLSSHNQALHEDCKNNFKQKVKLVHGDKYCLNEANYIRSSIKLNVKCIKHNNIFSITPNNLLRGKGCPLCAKDKKTVCRRIGILGFIQKATLVHNNKYNYDKCLLNTLEDIVCITCLDHGDFFQRANSHLKGCVGCLACRGVRNFTTETFILYCSKLHNYLYDYSKTEYNNIDSKVIIICKDHGEFTQNAYSHAAGYGCRKCSHKMYYSKGQIQWLTFMSIKYNTFIHHIGNNNTEYTIVPTRYKADGYATEINTVFEYYGDYYHGNPSIYDPETMNKTLQKTFGHLYKSTLEREEIIKSCGYNLIKIWEKEWLLFIKAIKTIQKKWRLRFLAKRH